MIPGFWGFSLEEHCKNRPLRPPSKTFDGRTRARPAHGAGESAERRSVSTERGLFVRMRDRATCSDFAGHKDESIAILSVSPAAALNRRRENAEARCLLRTALPPARPSRAGPCDPSGGGSRSRRSPRSRGCPGPAAIPTLFSLAGRDSLPSGCRATGPLRR